MDENEVRMSDVNGSSDAALRHAALAPQGHDESGRSTSSRLMIGGQNAGGADPKHPHLFHLSASAASEYDGGQLQGATADNWSILAGQQGAVYLARLAPGGVREPHWHPSAWEMNFVVSGRVRWSLVGPDGTSDAFDGGAGDLVFAPQGHFHYFENASEDEDLIVLIAFNSEVAEPKDDIGIVASLSGVPPEVLGAVFGAPAELFRSIPKNTKRVVIARKPTPESNDGRSSDAD
jgi:oxalate decarboxylase